MNVTRTTAIAVMESGKAVSVKCLADMTGYTKPKARNIIDQWLRSPHIYTVKQTLVDGVRFIQVKDVVPEDKNTLRSNHARIIEMIKAKMSYEAIGRELGKGKSAVQAYVTKNIPKSELEAMQDKPVKTYNSPTVTSLWNTALGRRKEVSEPTGQSAP